MMKERTLSEMIVEASRIYKISITKIKSDSRESEIVMARAYFVKLAVYEGYSHKETGRFIRRDRSTVINLLKKDLSAPIRFLNQVEVNKIKEEIQEVRSIYATYGGSFSPPKLNEYYKRDKFLGSFVFDN